MPVAAGQRCGFVQEQGAVLRQMPATERGREGQPMGGVLEFTTASAISASARKSIFKLARS